jgi:methionyl aminopeptidase
VCGSVTGYAIQTFAEKQGYSVVRELCGHGLAENFMKSPR